MPLELLKDLTVLEDLIVETAKECFREANPGRQRVRGLTEGISLRLTDVEDGSAKLAIMLFFTTTGLFPPANQAYFEQARERVVSAVDAAQRGEDASQFLNPKQLGYFNRFARGLKDDEAIELRPENADRPARLNKDTRRRLVLAAAEEITEEVVLRGVIPEHDRIKNTFELLQWNGRRIKASTTAETRDVVLEAFNGALEGKKVQVRAIGRYGRDESLRGIESVEDISILEPNDVPARLDEFRVLREGWLDGDGVALDSAGLDWLAEAFEANFPDDLDLPFLFPTPEGGVRAEWTLGHHEVTLDVNLATRKAEWHEIDMRGEEGTEREFDLAVEDGWQLLVERVRALAGGGAGMRALFVALALAVLVMLIVVLSAL